MLPAVDLLPTAPLAKRQSRPAQRFGMIPAPSLDDSDDDVGAHVGAHVGVGSAPSEVWGAPPPDFVDASFASRRRVVDDRSIDAQVIGH